MVGVLNHAQIAAKYADDVLSGEITACLFIKQAAKRFIRDLSHQNSRSFPFVFDADAGNKACRFIEKMPHIKGEWAKKGLRLELEPWQCFVVVNIFAWICARTIHDHDGNVMMIKGTRRFRTVYLEVARKNAKSTLVSAIGLYMLIADGEEGAEVYSAATTHKQAKIVWQDAKTMVEKSPGLRKHKHVDTNAKGVFIAERACKFEPLHSQGETLDGLNVHCAINDELHAHKKRDLYDVLETATGSRTQPLVLNITTAGTNKAGICYELRLYVVKLMQRVFSDETFFGMIYTLDKDDDPLDRSVWKKANPNYGVSVYPFDMERLAKKAAESPASMNNFLTKRLNVWCNAETAWMNMVEWDKCADPTLKEEDFYGDLMWVGVDLASKIDINAVVRLYKRTIDDETHVYAFPTFYLPEQAIIDGSNSQYDGWRRRELLTVTLGEIIDMDVIEDDVIALGDGRVLQEVCYDPGHNATQWATHLDDEGIDMVEVRPSVMNFSEPLKWMEALVKAGRFHHDGNEIMSWMVSNVVVQYDAKDNIYPRKERVENKIDGVVAICTGLNRLLADENADTDPTVMVI
jgi:phage terminase large subunit-like protein